jgi:uncharacterized protein with PIN domain
MIGTPADIGFIAKVIGKSRDYGARLFAIGKRIATLEERVSALEEELKTAPADACPYCGERSMRLKHQSGLMGNPGQQWTEDTWTCDKCRRDYIEREELKKARRS